MPSKEHRLHSLCPYFAMFPPSFVRKHLLLHTSPEDVVLDPFSGRGTTLLESILLERKALATDVNPVAACITGAKSRVPSHEALKARITGLEHEFKDCQKKLLDDERRSLPPFFARAFHYLTLREVLFLRGTLRWESDDVDRFISGLVLGSLHGEMDKSKSYFSNQMPRTISTKPNYSIQYWKRQGLIARRRRVFDILKQRATFRLEDGVPHGIALSVRADARNSTRLMPAFESTVKAIVTSPPYLDVTSFEEDQWLRLWFLGGWGRPTYGRIAPDDRHTSPRKYWRFLSEVWQGVESLLSDDAVIVCRIGGRHHDLTELASNFMASIRSAFPKATLLGVPLVTAPSRRQTDNFRPGTSGSGNEVDFIVRVA